MIHDHNHLTKFKLFQTKLNIYLSHQYNNHHAHLLDLKSHNPPKIFDYLLNITSTSPPDYIITLQNNFRMAPPNLAHVGA